MPTAYVVGPYQLSVSGEGSLLSQTGAFSGSGVTAVGFGDLAQVEFRLAAAISLLSRSQLPLPTVGAQFRLPLKERKYLPSFAVAVRIGIPNTEQDANGKSYDETVTDIYAVTSLQFWGPLRRLSLHFGMRFAFASITQPASVCTDVTPPCDYEKRQTLYLPAGGWEVQMTSNTRFIGELALVPRFAPVNHESIIDTKPLGRLGVRWYVHPSLILDASIGYGIEVAKFTTSNFAGNLSALVDWDMRLGIEFFIPWGAILCRAGNILCE